MRDHKSMPAAARCRRAYRASAPNLATAQASHQSKGLLAYTLHRKVPRFVGAWRVFAGQSLHAGFRIFYWASSRVWYHDIPKRAGRERERLRSLPGCVLLNCCMQDTNRWYNVCPLRRHLSRGLCSGLDKLNVDVFGDLARMRDEAVELGGRLR